MTKTAKNFKKGVKKIVGGVSQFTLEDLEQLKQADAEIDNPKRGRPFQEHVGVRALQMRRYRKRKAARLLEQSNGASENILIT